MFHSGNYGPPVGFCFDQFCLDEPMMDDPLMADYNVERRASDFADACQVRARFQPKDTFYGRVCTRYTFICISRFKGYRVTSSGFSQFDLNSEEGLPYLDEGVRSNGPSRLPNPSQGIVVDEALFGLCLRATAVGARLIKAT